MHASPVLDKIITSTMIYGSSTQRLVASLR